MTLNEDFAKVVIFFLFRMFLSILEACRNTQRVMNYIQFGYLLSKFLGVKMLSNNGTTVEPFE